MISSQINRRWTSGTLLLLCVCAGCGTGQYEKRLKATEEALTKGSVFAEMSPFVSVPDTSVRLRLPQSLGSSPLAEGTDARRLKPPSAQGIQLLPDRKLTFEGFQQYQGGKMAFYCYVAVTDMSAFGSRDPLRVQDTQIRQVFPSFSGQIEPVQCPTLEGVAVEWQHLQATGDQEFLNITDAGQESYQTTGGLMDVYCRQVGNHWVTIAWRVPTTYVDTVGLRDWAPRVAGSVKGD